MNTMTPSSRQESIRTIRMILFSAVGWLVYTGAFFVLKHTIAPQYFIHCRLDDLIPFLKWFFIAYCLWYPYLLVPQLYLAMTDRQIFFKLQVHMFIGLAICLLIYVIWPNGVDFRPVITETDLISRLMASMYAVDQPTMVTPSMHVFASVTIHLALVNGRRSGKRKLLLALSFVIMILICLSTVFVKQHSVLDIVWGVVLSLLLYFPIYHRRNKAADEPLRSE